MNIESLAKETVNRLSLRSEKLVLAESCTCGSIASVLGLIQGVSNYLCGSAVVYRSDSKKRWIGVSKKTIKKFTTESPEVATEMAKGVLRQTPEANWSASIVGHFGPDAPTDKDGLIHICFVRRTKKGKLKVKELVDYSLSTKQREKRQHEAVEVVLTHFTRILTKKSHDEKNGLSKNSRKKKS